MSEAATGRPADGEPDWTMSFDGVGGEAAGEFVAAGPSWWTPDDAIVPGVVPLSLVLGRSATAAVYLTAVRAYPDGLSMIVCVRTPLGSPPLELDEDSWPHPPSPGSLRWSLTFADETSVSSTDGWRSEGDDRRTLYAGGGSSSDRGSDVDYLLHPLPPPGPVTISCTWPDRGLETTEQSVDAKLFLDAAARARPLWLSESQGT